MTDLVKRLRERKGFWLNGAAWMMATTPDIDCQEAADEIERLKGEIDVMRERACRSDYGNSLLRRGISECGRCGGVIAIAGSPYEALGIMPCRCIKA